MNRRWYPLALLALSTGCGADGPIDQPAPPPEPSSILSKREPDVVIHSGVIAEVSASTHSWTSVGAGERRICLLSGHGVLELDGKVAQVEDLKTGMIIKAEGKEVDDFLLVVHATVAPPPPDVVDGAGPADAVGAATNTAPRTGSSSSTAVPVGAAAPTPPQDQ